MEAEKIIEEARNSIGTFCMEECKSYCCRKGYLVLTQEQVSLVSNSMRKELEDTKKLKLIMGKYSLDLSVTCPSLKDYKCSIHTHENRPQACKDFPLFIDKKWIKLSPRCLAVKMNKLYPYIHQLLKLGYRLALSNPYSDSDFYKIVQ